MDVESQPFNQALRVDVPQATESIWSAQIMSPRNTAPIKKGDKLFGYIDVRAESGHESGGGQFTGWVQYPGDD